MFFIKAHKQISLVRPGIAIYHGIWTRNKTQNQAKSGLSPNMELKAH